MNTHIPVSEVSGGLHGGHIQSTDNTSLQNGSDDLDPTLSTLIRPHWAYRVTC